LTKIMPPPTTSGEPSMLAPCLHAADRVEPLLVSNCQRIFPSAVE
jgi:hypothetical protein